MALTFASVACCAGVTHKKLIIFDIREMFISGFSGQDYHKRASVRRIYPIGPIHLMPAVNSIAFA